MADILVVGSANMDLVVATDRLPVPGETLLGGAFESFSGGKGANQAVAVARAGGSVAMIGRVGRDEFGGRLLAGLKAAGVEVDGVQAVDGSSGVALIVTAPNGDNMIVVAPGANDYLDAAALEPSLFQNTRFVLAQLETPLEGVMRAATLARACGAQFILDPAPACPLPRELLKKIDWITPNESEARTLLGLGEARVDGREAAMLLRAQGASGVVLKLGARGALLLPPDGEPIEVPAHRVRVVDTTAAGDAFNGAFAVALCEGASALDAVRFAVAASALAVTRRGAQPSMASRNEIERLLAREPVAA